MLGISTSPLATTGTIILHPVGYSSKGGENANSVENRIIETYGGFTTKLSTNVNSTSEVLTIANASSIWIKNW